MQFLLVVFPRAGQCTDQIDAFREVFDGLGIGRATQGALTSLSPVLDPALGLAGLCEVMSSNLRLGCHDIGIVLFENTRNHAMQFLAPAPHKTCVRSILDE